MAHLISDVRVVGLGKVGELLAELLIDSGFAVTGYDFRARGDLPFQTRMLDVRDSAALTAALLGATRSCPACRTTSICSSRRRRMPPGCTTST